MALIPLVEYAKRIGKPRNTVYHKYQNGTFKTAVKMGRDIWIDEDEPYTDARMKSGVYVGWRENLKKNQAHDQVPDQEIPAEQVDEILEEVEQEME